MTITLPEDLSQQLETLAQQQNRTPEAVLRDLLSQYTMPSTPPTKRTPGLNRGSTVYISDEFDDPLGDEFWLGEA